MTDTPKDVVFLTDHIPGKGPAICLWSEDREIVERFRVACYLSLPKSLGWFHQCNGETYQMFEFWTPDSAEMTAIAQVIATEIETPVHIRLTNTYEGRTPNAL